MDEFLILFSVQRSCGEISNENCTFFVNSGYPTAYDGVGSCQLTVNKVSTNICQLRLVLTNFFRYHYYKKSCDICFVVSSVNYLAQLIDLYI